MRNVGLVGVIDRKGDSNGGVILKLLGLMAFLQCFQYKYTDFVPALDVGLTVSPDRFVFITIFVLALWKFVAGKLQYMGLGKIGWCMLIVAVVSTISAFTVGAGSKSLYRLFDFSYAPICIFLLAKSIPHGRNKVSNLMIVFMIIGVYLAINGAFEHFQLQSLVWPKYILDPHIGIQFGRTRGSFASSEQLGMALIVCFLFYVFYSTHAQGVKLWWTYLMLIIITGVLYTTNQRAAWVAFGICLFVLAFAKTNMKQVSRVIACVILLGFVLGIGTHFSLWEATLFSKRQNTVDYRAANFATTLAMGMANPIFGVGYGNFKTEWQKYFSPPPGIEIRDLADGNHNTFLGLFSEVGLVGLIPYILMIFFMFRLGIRVYNQREGLDKHFSLVAILALMTYVTSASFSDKRNNPFINTALFLIFGCIAAMDTHKNVNKRKKLMNHNNSVLIRA